MVSRILLVMMLMATLSAGALSARQLRTGTHAIVACGSPCIMGDSCKQPCTCFIFHGTTGVCQPDGPDQ